MGHSNKSLKDIAHSQRKQYRLIFAGLLFAVSSLLFSFFFGEMGLINFSKMKAASVQAKQEITLLEIKNNQVLHQIEGLRTDPLYVEAIARERLGLVKKGEIVYEFYNEEEAPAVR